MKKIIKLIVSAFVALALNACGNSTEGAKNSSNILQENDLVEALSESNSSLTFKSYEVEKSLTEDSTYTASLIVYATNSDVENYEVDFSIPVDVEYTKYDQGWSLDKCTMPEFKGYALYEVKKFPSIEYLQDLRINKYSNDMYNNDLDILIDSEEGDYDFITYSKNKEGGKYLTKEQTGIYTWNYDLTKMEWDFDLKVKSTFILNDDLIGKSLENDDLLIENITPESVTVTFADKDIDIDGVVFEYEETTEYFIRYRNKELKYDSWVIIGPEEFNLIHR